MSLLYLSTADIEQLLPPVPDVLELVRESFAGLAAGRTQQPPTLSVRPRPTGFADALVTYLGDRDLTCVKWVGGDERNSARGLPYLGGLIILNDSETSLPTAVMDAGTITSVRTAAVSGACIQVLAPDCERIAIIGFGVQARAHARILHAVNPAVSIRVVTRRPETVVASPGIEVVATAEEAVSDADVVITAIPLTARLQPQIDPSWLAPGALVLPLDDDAAVSTQVVNGSERFLVDSLSRFGDNRQEGLFCGWRDPDGSVADAIVVPQQLVEGLTVCMNQGIGAMDAPLAAAVLDAALAGDVGTRLP